MKLFVFLIVVIMIVILVCLTLKGVSAEPITEHFKREEFNQRSNPLPLDQVIVDYELCQMLEVLRISIGNKPIKITSGFRTPEHNKAVGGAKNSQHLYGKAADIQVEGMTPAEVAEKAKLYFSFVKIYSKHLHIDIR